MIAVAVSVLLSVPVFAFGPYPECGSGRGPRYGEGRGMGYHRDAGFAKLNLTDEQKTKIEELRTAHWKEIRPIREKMFDKSVELRRAWLQADPDKSRIVALQKEVRVLRDQLEDKSTEHRLSIQKTLTPEQRDKLANSGWGRGPGFGPRGGMRGPGGAGPGICY